VLFRSAELEQRQPTLMNRKYTVSDVDHEAQTISIMVAEVQHERTNVPLLQEGVMRSNEQARYTGAATRMLLDTRSGDEVPLTQDMRRRKLRYPSTSDEKPVLMVGTGVGMAPHIAFLRELAREEDAYKGDLWLVEGGRYKDAVISQRYLDELGLGEQVQFDYIASRSGEASERGYVQDVLRGQREKLEALIDAGGSIHICGFSGALEGVREVIMEIAQDRGMEDPMDFVRELEVKGQLQSSTSVPTRFHDKFERKYGADKAQAEAASHTLTQSANTCGQACENCVTERV